jgi:hypothetical protein
LISGASMSRKNARIVDQQHLARERRRPHIAAAEPVREGLRQEMADVDDLGGAALDHGIAEDARTLARHLDVEPLLDDVDDLVDDEAHGAAMIGEHQDRLRAVLLDAGLPLSMRNSGMS